MGRVALVTHAWPAHELGVVGDGGKGCRRAVSSASCAECPPEPFPLVLNPCLQPMILGLEDESFLPDAAETRGPTTPTRAGSLMLREC